MNAYTTRFFCECPNNGVRVDYQLRIETRETLMVESILVGIQIDTDEARYHEELADLLLKRFGGTQTLMAEHHSVHIETLRRALTTTPEQLP